MTHSKSCSKNNSEIPLYRERYNPTFYHHQIFNNVQIDLKKSHCTPTFHSTALDTEGYNIKTIHKKPQKQTIRPNSAVQGVYLNNTQRKRIQDLNTYNFIHNCSGHQWYDHTKQNIISSLVVDCNSYGYSKQRKHIDLSSDPVFLDYNYGANSLNVNQLKQNQSKYCPKQDNQNHHQEIVQTQQPQQLKVIQGNNKQVISIENKASQAIKQDRVIHNKQDLKNPSAKKDYHKNCIPEIDKKLKLKGKKIEQRPHSARKVNNVVSQKPTFTVIRKNRIPLIC